MKCACVSTVIDLVKLAAKNVSCLLSHLPLQQNSLGHCVFYGMESLSGALEWNIGLEWSQILNWQMF